MAVGHRLGDRTETPCLGSRQSQPHQRRFVLQPLSEIAPELILPGQKKTVLQLLSALADKFGDVF